MKKTILTESRHPKLATALLNVVPTNWLGLEQSTSMLTPVYSDQVASQARSHVQFQALVPSSTVVRDVRDWNKPSGNVVNPFSRKSSVDSWSRPVNVSAGILVIPAVWRSISSSNGWPVNIPEGSVGSRKSASIINFRSESRPAKLSEVRGPIIPPLTLNSLRDVRFARELLAIPVREIY